MHELSLAMSVMDIVERESGKLHNPNIKAIEIEIGDFAGVEISAFRFSMEAVIKASLHSGAEVRIIQLPAIAECKNCGMSFNAVSRFCCCPGCGEYGVALVQGMEFRLTAIVFDDIQDKDCYNE